MDILDDKNIDSSLIGEANRKDGKYLLSKLTELLSYRTEEEILYILENLNQGKDYIKKADSSFSFLTTNGNIEEKTFKDRISYREELGALVKLADDKRMLDLREAKRRLDSRFNSKVKEVGTVDAIIGIIAAIIGYSVMIFGGAHLAYDIIQLCLL